MQCACPDVTAFLLFSQWLRQTTSVKMTILQNFGKAYKHQITYWYWLLCDQV